MAGKDESCGPCIAASDRSCVLDREKALGDLDDQHDVERYRKKKHHQGEGRMFQHPMQACAIQR